MADKLITYDSRTKARGKNRRRPIVYVSLDNNNNNNNTPYTLMVGEGNTHAQFDGNTHTLSYIHTHTHNQPLLVDVWPPSWLGDGGNRSMGGTIGQNHRPSK